jgi:hypothetical protein
MSLIETRSRKERARLEQIRMECRANRHKMDRFPPPPGWVAPTTAYWRVAKKVLHKRCSVCGTWRHIAMTHRFTVLTSYYAHPDGYLQDAGEGKISTESLRRWEFEQVEAMTGQPTRRAG